MKTKKTIKRKQLKNKEVEDLLFEVWEGGMETNESGGISFNEALRGRLGENANLINKITIIC